MDVPPRIREEFAGWFDVLDWAIADGVEWVRMLNGMPGESSGNNGDTYDLEGFGEKWTRVATTIVNRSPADHAWLTVMGESSPPSIFELYPFLAPLEGRYYGSAIDHPAGRGFDTPWLAVDLKPDLPPPLPPPFPPRPPDSKLPIPPTQMLVNAVNFAVSLWDRPPSLDELKAIAFGDPFIDRSACIAAVADTAGPHTLWCAWRNRDYFDAVSRVGVFRGNLLEPV